MHAAPIEEVIEDFSRHLIRLETYVEAWNNDPDNRGHQIRPNAQALFLSVKSSHDDIARYKAYHLSDPRNGISNSVKMSAYLCKWMARFKVVELATPDSQDEHEDVTAILLNGAFALYLCRTLIGAELKTPFYFTDQYGDEFQYDLLYREIGEDGLLHIFQMIFTAVGIRRAGVLEFLDKEVATSVFDDQA
jgi:hypothetical protein